MRNLQVKAWGKLQQAKALVSKMVNSERGDIPVAQLGMALIGVVVIVIVHGIITGWLPTFLTEKILDPLNNL